MQGSPVIFAGGQSIRMDGQSINSAVEAFHAGAASGRQSRGDSAGHALKSYRQEINERRIDGWLRANTRADGFSSGAGFHLARDLEHVHKTVLTEEFPIPNSFDMFGESETVPVGANSHTMRRVYDQGEAKIWRGPGDKVPRVSNTQREETWPIRHLVSGYAWDIFEAQSDKFAGNGQLKHNARTARDVIMELANRINWQGDAASGLYGVLNYPWLDKYVIANGFSQATVTAAPLTTLADLHALANYPQDNSDSVFQPNMLAVTEAVHTVINSTPLGSGSDTTILQHFLKTSAHIKGVKVAWELKDAGGAGIDGILAYRDDQRGFQRVNPQGITQLPMQEQGLEMEIINHMSTGGMVCPDVKNNILGYANTAT